MSISSEISRISGNVSGAFSAVMAKGGTVPINANSDNLASTIQSIPTGSSPLILSCSVNGALYEEHTAEFTGGTFDDAISALNAGNDVYLQITQTEPGTDVVEKYIIQVTEIYTEPDGSENFVALFGGIPFDSANGILEVTIHTESPTTVWMCGYRVMLPKVDTKDEGKILQVSGGRWVAATIPNASGVSF